MGQGAGSESSERKEWKGKRQRRGVVEERPGGGEMGIPRKNK